MLRRPGTRLHPPPISGPPSRVCRAWRCRLGRPRFGPCPAHQSVDVEGQRSQPSQSERDPECQTDGHQLQRQNISYRDRVFLGPPRPGCCSLPGCTFLRTQPVLTPHSGTHLTTRSPPPRLPFGARSRSRPCGGSPSRGAGRDPRRLQLCSELSRRRHPRRRPRTPHRAGPASFGHSSGAFAQKWSDMCKTLRLEGASRAAPPPSRRISDELSRTP